MIDRILLHISGPDKPGITASLTKILYDENVTLIDLGQNVLNNFLILTALVEIPTHSQAIKKLLFEVGAQGMHLDIKELKKNPSENKISSPLKKSFCVTLMGEDLGNNSAVSGLSTFLAEKKLNILEIHTLSQKALKSLELIVSSPLEDEAGTKLSQLRGDILELSKNLNVDLAIQKNNVFRKHRQLICFDVDSTFVEMEVIDELAVLHGCAQKVAPITERAMRGEIDFDSALRERVLLLAGLEVSKIDQLTQNIPLSPGVPQLMKALKILGFKIGLISGGFSFFVNALKDRFQLDFAFSNELEIINGKLSGKLLGPIINAEAKAQKLQEMILHYGLRPEQSIAVGDGANDRLMLQASGLGIAYRAKAKLQAVADLSLNFGGLETILFLMGLNESELGASLESE